MPILQAGSEIRLKHEKEKTEAFFLIFFALFLCLLFINQTELLVRIPAKGQAVMRALRYFCYLAFMIVALKKETYQKNHLLIMMFVAVGLTLCAIESTRTNIILIAIVSVAAYGCNYRKIIKCTATVFSTGLISTIALCHLGILNNQILSTGRARYNLGFNWVTLGPIYLLFIVICIVNLRKEKITVLELVLLEFGAYYLYVQTNARLAFLLTTAIIAFVFIEKHIFNNEWRVLRTFRTIVIASPFIICGLIFIIQFLYNPSIGPWDTVNNLLSGRLQLVYDNLKTLRITLFGQNIAWQGFSLGEGYLTRGSGYLYNNVDCSYFRILFDYGIFGLLVTLSVYSYGLYKAYELDDQYLVFSYLVVLLFSVTEQWIIEPSFNPFVIIAVATMGETVLSKRNSLSVERKKFEIMANA